MFCFSMNFLYFAGSTAGWGVFHCLLKICAIICSINKRLGYRTNIKCSRPGRLDLLQGELQVTLTSDTVEFLAQS